MLLYMALPLTGQIISPEAPRLAGAAAGWAVWPAVIWQHALTAVATQPTARPSHLRPAMMDLSAGTPTHGVDMHILVTGGLGFIGTAVLRDLLAVGKRVTTLSRGVGGRRPPPGVCLVRGDIRDPERMQEIISAGEFDGICHLAALTSAGASHTHPLEHFDVNLGGTLNLLKAVDGMRQRPPSFVLASTYLVYGRPHVGRVEEAAHPYPASPYAASKVAAENLVAGYAATGKTGATILRFFNVSGAVAGVGDPDSARLVPKLMGALRSRSPVLALNRPGSQVRDFIHVEDAAMAVRLALDAEPARGHRLYNIGSGVGTSVSEVVQAAEQVTGRRIKVGDEVGNEEPDVVIADNRRAVSELDWRPCRSDLWQIVADAWDAAR